jgi:hypothetical protein
LNGWATRQSRGPAFGATSALMEKTPAGDGALRRHVRRTTGVVVRSRTCWRPHPARRVARHGRGPCGVVPAAVGRLHDTIDQCARSAPRPSPTSTATTPRGSSSATATVLRRRSHQTARSVPAAGWNRLRISPRGRRAVHGPVMCWQSAARPDDQRLSGRQMGKAPGQQASTSRDTSSTSQRIPIADVVGLHEPEATTDQRCRWSVKVLSPPPESNRRPHPYHRCAGGSRRRAVPHVPT